MDTTAVTMVHSYLDALFQSDDIIEVRPIETWTDASGRKRSRVLRAGRRWLAPSQIVQRLPEFDKLNRTERANIFVGVNPRQWIGASAKCGVARVRCLWADVDDCSVQHAERRFAANDVPRPSVLINSGNGVHAYWLLETEIDVTTDLARMTIESTLATMYRRVGLDATQDVNRLLRLPGFLNQKNARYGGEPVACELVQCNTGLRYTWSTFLKWQSGGQPESKYIVACHPRPVGDGVVSLADLPLEQAFTVSRLSRDLENRVSDRSRRDYAVICELLRLGLSKEQLWRIVRGHSKFASGGWQYFETTLENARRSQRR